MREVRVALLEADVALPVVRDFIAKATRGRHRRGGDPLGPAGRPGGQDRLRRPGRDAGRRGRARGPEPRAQPADRDPDGRPAGLGQDHHRRPSWRCAWRKTSARRCCWPRSTPAVRPPWSSWRSLAHAGRVETLPIVAGQAAADIARRALLGRQAAAATTSLILDTAGRTTLDEAMMSEAAEIARIASPAETLLVADSLTGQDAVRTAKAFHERLPLTGLVLTRADGDGRGGAALSMRAVTGLPIKFLGVWREDRRAGRLRRPPRGRPHPGPGRRRGPGREGRRRTSTRPRPRPWPRSWPRASSTST